MQRAASTGDLFVPEPATWGLRGDPWLWRALQERFASSPLPADGPALQCLVEQAFAELTGHPMAAPGYLHVEAFAHGGLSSGGISPVFWRETALPLLRSRLAVARKPDRE